MITFRKTSLALMYKRKILLKRNQDYSNVGNKNNWSFIEEGIGGNESTIMKKVEKEMSINLISIKLLSSGFGNTARSSFYCVGLTDKNVNDIKRHDGEELQFFNIREVEKLSLDESSRLLFKQYKSTLEAAFDN